MLQCTLTHQTEVCVIINRALEYIKNNPVDAIISDVKMPVISGIDLAKICYEEFPDISVILISAYRDFEYARQVLAEGTLYVGEDETGTLWGVVNLNGIQLPEYDQIPWKIPAEREQVGVIHTLVIHPTLSRRGYARQMVEFCEEESRRLGKAVIRLDTWEGNLPAKGLYEQFGFVTERILSGVMPGNEAFPVRVYDMQRKR